MKSILSFLANYIIFINHISYQSIKIVAFLEVLSSPPVFKFSYDPYGQKHATKIGSFCCQPKIMPIQLL
jgi:hypothetical protein